MDLGKLAPARRSAHLRKILKGMLETSRALLENRLLIEILSRIPGIARQEFKDESNRGFVWEHRRHVDKGNWKYCLLFEYLTQQVGPDHVLVSLAERWPSLSKDHPQSDSALEMCADVVEFILADCRYTGNAVPRELREARIKLHSLLKRFVDSADDLVRILVNFDPDVRVRAWANPRDVYSAAIQQ